MNTFTYEVTPESVVPDTGINSAAGYDSFITIYTRANKAGYDFGCVVGKERQLSVILHFLSTDKMFQELCQNIPEQMEGGSKIVEDAFSIIESLEDEKVLEQAIVQPISFAMGE